MMSGKDFLNNHVLSWWRKVYSDWEVLHLLVEHSRSLGQQLEKHGYRRLIAFHLTDGTRRHSLSPSISVRHNHLHELSPYRSIQSMPPCRRQAQIERAQIVLNRSQPGLPRSTGTVLPVFGRTPSAGLKSLRMVLTGVGMTNLAKERQVPSMDSIRQEWLTRMRPNHFIGDKIHPVNMGNTFEAPIIQCINLLCHTDHTGKALMTSWRTL